jgi:hypothetical protein
MKAMDAVKSFGDIRRRYGMTAFIGYTIVAIFSIAYGFARLAWPHLPEHQAIMVGVLAAGPLVFAFIWERLVGFKLFGVEVTLSQFTVQIESTLATALSESQYFSGNPEIFGVIDRVLADESIELLEINLRDHPYWWDTRLFLQAALIDDCTNIQRIVFVADDRRYLGMTAPGALRRSLAHRAGMNLELVYQQIADSAQHVPAQIVNQWCMQPVFKMDGRDQIEGRFKTELSAKDVAQLVSLETASLEPNAPLDSALVHALVLEKGMRFVALTQNGLLENVVNVDDFARKTTAQLTRTQLSH